MSMKKKSASLVFFFSFVGCLASIHALEIEYAKVFEVVGSAKFSGLKNGRWEPLPRNTVLRSGSRIKTGDGSSVQIKLNRNFTGALKVSPNSYLEFKNEPPNKIFIEKGDVYVIREMDPEIVRPAESGVLKISTKDLLIEIKQGGCIVSVTDQGTWLKVFQEEVSAIPLLANRAKTRARIVHEGTALYAKRSPAQISSKRMRYEDYDAWQVWIRSWYGHTDKVAAEKLRKELHE